jgi:hypothetical protein
MHYYRFLCLYFSGVQTDEMEECHCHTQAIPLPIHSSTPVQSDDDESEDEPVNDTNGDDPTWHPSFEESEDDDSFLEDG